MVNQAFRIKIAYRSKKKKKEKKKIPGKGRYPMGPTMMHFRCLLQARVAEVAREHGWHPPRSLDSKILSPNIRFFVAN